MTARQDFTIDAGRDYGLNVSLFEADNVTPLNLLDSELQWIVTKETSGTPLISKSSVDSTEIEITSIGEGLITIHINQLDTEALGALTCEHELMMTDVVGSEATLMRGLVTILRSYIT